MIKIGYRADIDALRGIAVLLVLFDHLGMRFVSAGFVGVDIFFIISGFLITLHILRDTRKQIFSLQKFYLHRMRRILPTLVVILFFTTVAAYLLFLPSDLKNYSQSLLATVFSIPNIYFWKFIHIGYFSTDATILPLLHTWSLGVEEQFYIIWPLFLFFLIKSFSEKKALLVIYLLTIFSFSVYYLFKADPLFAYYSPITRAFELLTGGVLAINYEKNQIRMNKNMNDLMSIIGLFLILYSACILTEADYPGLKILLPCCGTVLLLYTGTDKHALGIGNRILSNRILIFIGLISYSLYLWHWPIISYVNYFRIPIDFKVSISIIFASISLSYLTWRFVEYPFRSRIRLPFIRTCSIFLAVPTVMALIFYILAMYFNDFGFNKISTQRLQEAESYYGILKQEYGCIDNKEGPRVLPSKQLCVIGNLDLSKTSVLVVGDSHALAAVGMLDIFLSRQNLQAYVATQSGSPFILGNISNWRDNNPMDRNKLLKEAIKNGDFKYIVMAGFWDYYPDLPAGDNKTHTPFQVFNKGLQNAVNFVIKNKKIPVIIFDPPPLLNILNTCGLSRISFDNCNNKFKQIKQLQENTRKIIVNLKKKFPQIILIDPSKVICDTKSCYSSIKGTPLYSSYGENSHLGFAGSTLIGKLYLEKYGNPFGNDYAIS